MLKVSELMELLKSECPEAEVLISVESPKLHELQPLWPVKGVSSAVTKEDQDVIILQIKSNAAPYSNAN